MKIRSPTVDELPRLSDLCFRSKPVWGYDEAFLEACRSELSFHPRDLQLTCVAVAEDEGRLVGVVQVTIVGDEADLLKLFVEPEELRRGTGSALFAWAADVSRKMIVRRDGRPYFSSNSTNSMSVVPVFFTALVCPASCQMKSPSYGAMPRSADPVTISASTPPWM